MKRYMLFAFNCFAPSGGMFDFIGPYDAVEECFEVFEDCDHNYDNTIQIYDMQLEKVILHISASQFYEEYWIGDQYGY